MEQERKRSWLDKARGYIIEYKRVLRVTKKPTKEEFKAIVKVSALGILLIGAIGFSIRLIQIAFG